MKATRRLFGWALCLSAALLLTTANLSAQAYQPAKPRSASGKVFTDHVTLITGQQDTANRVSVEDLASFIRSAEAEAYPILARCNGSALIRLLFNCQPGEHTVKIASQGSPPQSVLQELYDAMMALPPLRASGEVIFQIEIHVRP